MGGWLLPEGRAIHFQAAGDSIRVGRECVVEGGGMLDTVKRNAPLGSNQSARRLGVFSLTPSSGGGRAISQRLCWPQWLIKTQPAVAHEYQSRTKERIRLAKSGIKQQRLKKKGLNAGCRRGELIYLSFLESKQSSRGTPSRSNPRWWEGHYCQANLKIIN